MPQVKLPIRFRRVLVGAMFALTLGALLCSPSASQAATIVVWNFNDAGVSGTNSPANTILLFSPDRGTGSMSSNFDAAHIVDFNGTTNNADAGDPAGVALALQGGVNNANNGQNLTFSTNATGFSNLIVSLAIQRTATGFNSDQFQYSANGSTFVNFGSPFNPSTNFTIAGGVQTFDLSSIGALNNNSLATFRIVFNGVTSELGNNRIDNLIISGTAIKAVPEPGAVSMSFCAFVAGAGWIIRRRKR